MTFEVAAQAPNKCATNEATAEPLRTPNVLADNLLARSNLSEGESPEKSGEAEKPEEQGNALMRCFHFILPRGGALSGIFNLASVTLGAGIMSIPSAFNTSGMIMAIIYLVLVTVFTVFSIFLIVSAAEKTGYRSFESMARNLLGPRADIAVGFLLWLLCFGGASGYVVAIGDVLQGLLSHEKVPAYLQSKGGRRLLTSAIWFVFIFPLTLPKRVNSLRYASAIGVSFILFFAICVVEHSAEKMVADGGIEQELVMFRSGNDAVAGLSLFIFAYLCHVNSFSIFFEMKKRSVTRMTRDAAVSCSICCCVYLLTGFFGYAEFGPTVEGSVLKLYDPYANPVFFVCFIGIIVKLCAGFSLNMLACRTALFQVLRWDLDTMSYVRHSIVSVSFAVGSLVLGLFVPDINVIFGLVGAFCGGFIGFIFPALFIMYAGGWTRQSVGWVQYILTYVLLILGVVAIVFGTSASVYYTIKKYS
ncbi:amino acid transporter [Trypanosoma brucei equiperdum]|uniref:Amino acid transporter n=1 Tax=Trypanosoma brucei equiperdum TaxID=630700 RepID=A0A3L6LFU2_9TRYP|nr:amino acid transporter [Trypanosoma brucei equiperdum]